MKFKQFLKTLVISFLIIPCMVAFSACSFSGKDGKSAYELAVENGFEGTVQDWLDSLKGSNGQNGRNGIDQTSETSYDLWQNAVAAGEFIGTYLDFVEQKLTINYDNFSLTSNKCLSSVVTVNCYNTSPASIQNTGSGIIYSIDADYNAFIVTNYHVAYYSNENGHYNHFLINLYGNDDSKDFEAEFVGGSATYDIAVLYVSECETLKNYNAKSINLFYEDVNFGEVCLAIGNTSGYGIAVTKGCVSVDSEYNTSSVAGLTKDRRYIRHSAFISNGNSGGGLFNIKGEFIGLTNGGLKNNSNNIIGYLAIPSSIVKGVTENIINNCFNQQNRKLKVYDLGLTFSVSESQTSFNESTGFVEIVDKVKVSSINSYDGLNGKDIQLHDQIVSAKIISNETITKNITRIFNYEDLILLLKSNDKLVLTLTRNGTDTFDVELNISDFETKTII